MLALAGRGEGAWDATSRDKDLECSDFALMAVKQHYCTLYTSCCDMKLDVDDCLDKEVSCQTVDATFPSFLIPPLCLSTRGGQLQDREGVHGAQLHGDDDNDDDDDARPRRLRVPRPRPPQPPHRLCPLPFSPLPPPSGPPTGLNQSLHCSLTRRPPLRTENRELSAGCPAPPSPARHGLSYPGSIEQGWSH